MIPILNRLTEVAKSNWANPILFFLSVLIICLSWVVVRPAFLLDPDLSFGERASTDYVEQTSKLIADQGFTSFVETPLLPIILTVIYDVTHTTGFSETAALALYTLTFTALSTVVLFQTAKLIWGPLAAFIVACLWASYPPAALTASYLGSETPFILGLFLSFYFLLRLIKEPRHILEYVALGASIGFTMLARAEAVGLPPLFLIVLWIGTRHRSDIQHYLIQAAAILGAILILVLPWELLAYSKLQSVILLSSGDAMSIVDGAVYAYNLKYHCPIAIPDDVYALQRDIDNQHFQTTGPIITYFIGEMTTRPGTVILHFVIKALNSWYRTTSCQYDDVLLLIQIPYVLLFIIATFQGLRRAGAIRRITLLAWLMLSYFWVMSILVFSSLRMMLPGVAILFLILPAAAYLWQHSKTDETPTENVAIKSAP